jgi:hypothetical protein
MFFRYNAHKNHPRFKIFLDIYYETWSNLGIIISFLKNHIGLLCELAGEKKPASNLRRYCPLYTWQWSFARKWVQKACAQDDHYLGTRWNPYKKSFLWFLIMYLDGSSPGFASYLQESFIFGLIPFCTAHDNA